MHLPTRRLQRHHMNPLHVKIFIIQNLQKILDEINQRAIKFDFKSFHPSISLDLFQQKIDFARETLGITNTDISIFMEARKTLLFREGVHWVKQSMKKMTILMC